MGKGKDKEDRLDRVHKKNYLKKLLDSDDLDLCGEDYNNVGTKRQANEIRDITPSPKVSNATIERDSYNKSLQP